jgi:hypothetical protein
MKSKNPIYVTERSFGQWFAWWYRNLKLKVGHKIHLKIFSIIGNLSGSQNYSLWQIRKKSNQQEKAAHKCEALAMFKERIVYIVLFQWCKYPAVWRSIYPNIDGYGWIVMDFLQDNGRSLWKKSCSNLEKITMYNKVWSSWCQNLCKCNFGRSVPKLFYLISNRHWLIHSINLLREIISALI